jgi:hypothetical protein
MATNMTLETMKGVFLTYFEVHHITDIEIHENDEQTEGTWQVPPDTFDVHPLVTTVWFRGPIEPKNPIDGYEKSAFVELRTQYGTTDKQIYPYDPTGMYNALTQFIPPKNKMEHTTTPESASVIAALNKTNEALAYITHILQRIEENLNHK